jgi:hypothetical protein
MLAALQELWFGILLQYLLGFFDVLGRKLKIFDLSGKVFFLGAEID